MGIAYTASLTASGGPTPYKWSVDSGALPAGLTLGADGTISGVPAADGTFNVTVRATDSDNQYTTQGATIKIASRLTASLVAGCQQVCSVEQGCVTVCGTFGQQSGGVGPFTYSASGNIPGGMKVSGLSLAGSFPSLAQFWQFNVTITDALGATATLSPVFYVFKHIAITPTTVRCSSQSPANCSVQLSYGGGTPGGTPSVRSHLVSASICTITAGQFVNSPYGNYPPGYSATASGGVITVSAASRPPNACGYTATITITLTDQSPCGNGNCVSNVATINMGF